MTDTLYIAAKAPRAGHAKTRLGEYIGQEEAATLYRAFLRDLAARFTGGGTDISFATGWYITPPEAWADLAPLVGGDGNTARMVVQGEGDWTERQRQLFSGAAGRGEERLVLVASDSPHLSVEVVEGAFRELDSHDLVLGPTHDGGYYLIGMQTTSGAHGVLRGIPMSTDTVLDDIAAGVRESGLSVGWVPPTFDVDEAGDLEHLRRVVRSRADLPATRAALEKLGLMESSVRPAAGVTRDM